MDVLFVTLTLRSIHSSYVLLFLLGGSGGGEAMLFTLAASPKVRKYIIVAYRCSTPLYEGIGQSPEAK